MSRLNHDSASNIEKGTQPKRDFKVERFVDRQNKVELWAESHDIKHLLVYPPVADPIQLRKHEVAKRVILLTLPNQDRAYVKGSLTLNEIWGKQLAKYMPSTDAEARRLWSRFSASRQAGMPMVEHVNECMTVRNQLMAVGETVPEKHFIDKLLNIDRELSYQRPVLVRAPIDDIVAGLRTATVTTIKTASTSTSTAMPAGAASSANTREGNVHPQPMQSLRLWPK